MKVRSTYPLPLRLSWSALSLGLFYFVGEWLFGETVARNLAIVFFFVLLITVLGDSRNYTIEGSKISRGRRFADASEVVRIESVTRALKWNHGVSSTYAKFFTAGSNKPVFEVTDTRNPFSPNASGYSSKEAEVIQGWLTQIPETVEGFDSVAHVSEMLAIKNFK